MTREYERQVAACIERLELPERPEPMQEQGRLHLDRWADGKKRQLAMICQEVALGADLVAEYCERVRQLNREGVLRDGIDPKHWVQFFREHDTIMIDAGFVLATEEDEKHVMEFMLGVWLEGEEWMRNPVKKLKELLQPVIDEANVQTKGFVPDKRHAFVRELNRGLREALFETDHFDGIYRVHLRTLKQKVDGTYGESPPPEELLRDPGILFFALIALPCWLEYGKSFRVLLHEARRGKPESVERLLRLDNRFVEDKRIRKHVYRAADKAKAGEGAKESERYFAAMSGVPEGRLRQGTVKMMMAAFLYKVCKALDAPFAVARKKTEKRTLREALSGFRLSVADIQRLFDAAARDRAAVRGETVLRDLDLPEDPASFDKLLRDHLCFWPNFRETLTKFKPRL